jgi:uncharacterized protein
MATKLLKVLSIDGGGIRGIIPAMMLARLEKDMGNKPVSEIFHLIAGTSSGGILTLFLTVPNEHGKPKYTAAECVRLLKQRMTEIFTLPQLKLARAALRREFYSYEGLQNALIGELGIVNEPTQGAMLEDALTNILIPSYDLIERKPRFFKSYQDKDRNKFRMWQIARATSSVPVFFEPYPFDMPPPSVLVDGGLVANNPGMCAYVEAMKMMVRRQEFEDLKEKYDEVVIVSLGCGYGAEHYEHKVVKDWYPWDWLVPLIKIGLDGPGGTTHYQLSQLLAENRYFRFQTTLEKGCDDLDDVSDDNITMLEGVANNIYDNCAKSWEEMIEVLKM